VDGVTEEDDEGDDDDDNKDDVRECAISYLFTTIKIKIDTNMTQ
jgi:hypothetical protein